MELERRGCWRSLARLLPQSVWPVRELPWYKTCFLSIISDFSSRVFVKIQRWFGQNLVSARVEWSQENARSNDKCDDMCISTA